MRAGSAFDGSEIRLNSWHEMRVNIEYCQLVHWPYSGLKTLGILDAIGLSSSLASRSYCVGMPLWTRVAFYLPLFTYIFISAKSQVKELPNPGKIILKYPILHFQTLFLGLLEVPCSTRVEWCCLVWVQPCSTWRVKKQLLVGEDVYDLQIWFETFSTLRWWRS